MKRKATKICAILVQFGTRLHCYSSVEIVLQLKQSSCQQAIVVPFHERAGLTSAHHLTYSRLYGYAVYIHRRFYRRGRGLAVDSVARSG
jgi:hypothetical protein